MKADLLRLLAGTEKASPLAVVQYFVGMTSWCFIFLFAHSRWLRGVRGSIHTGPRAAAALRALQALEVLVAGALKVLVTGSQGIRRRRRRRGIACAAGS
jgi:hypothetical protein